MLDSAMRLEQEVRHKSEDIEDAVLLDAVRAIRRRVKVINRDYDIPYIAGYSVDGHTVFIDRHLPRTFRWLLKTLRVEAFLLTHEIVEKALLDELRLHSKTLRVLGQAELLKPISDLLHRGSAPDCR